MMVSGGSMRWPQRALQKPLRHMPGDSLEASHPGDTPARVSYSRSRIRRTSSQLPISGSLAFGARESDSLPRSQALALHGSAWSPQAGPLPGRTPRVSRAETA
jgi:hypothetical protein